MASSSSSTPGPAASSASAPGHSQSWKLILQMAAGAGAGAVAKTATAPLERIKILFQVQVRLEAGAFDSRWPGRGDATRSAVRLPLPRLAKESVVLASERSRRKRHTSVLAVITYFIICDAVDPHGTLWRPLRRCVCNARVF